MLPTCPYTTHKNSQTKSILVQSIFDNDNYTHFILELFDIRRKFRKDGKSIQI